MKTSSVLKSLAVAIILSGSAIFTTGCSHNTGGTDFDLLAPPAYTSNENFHRQLRYAAYDWQQAIDDFDREVVMTRPASRLSRWDIRQSD
jgi:hypothetical protein